jgi:tctex1 domain-containing protein 2
MSCVTNFMLQVTVCQDTGQAMRVASRCLWDPANDGSACQYFRNDTLACICQVFGLYLE